jgi:hypothetical protein
MPRTWSVCVSKLFISVSIRATRWRCLRDVVITDCMYVAILFFASLIERARWCCVLNIFVALRVFEYVMN